MSLFRTRGFSALIAVCAAGAPMMACAAEPASEVSQVEVQAGDLDLSTAHDQAVLQHRLRMAARRVCRTDNPSFSAMSDEMLSCQAQAMESAREKAQSLVQLAEAGRAVSLEASAVPR
jgi:UrcA family protein